MEFPRLVFRVPGPHQCAGGSYDYVLTEDKADYSDRLKNGWHATVGDAQAPKAAESEPVVPDNAPPTRAELETKARELGIKFDGRTGDAKLSADIARTLKG